MRKTIKIGGMDVPMAAPASCNIYYKRVFSEDALQLQAAASKSEDNAASLDLFSKMGFIMAKFAENPDRAAMSALTEDDYIVWLEQFSNMDFLNAIGEIAEVYSASKSTTSKEKKQ